MKKSALFALALGAAFLLPRPARAWDDVGHRVVARIAWETMRPQTRARVIALLMQAPDSSGIRDLLDPALPAAIRERELFVRAATWADIIRDKTVKGAAYHQPSWHYVNHFWEQAYEGAPPRISTRGTAGMLVDSLNAFEREIADPNLDAGRRAVLLAWVEHLTGDAHQPLHNSARMTLLEPQGDHGGNDFKLEGTHSLHGYWDSALSRRFPLLAGETVESRVGRIAAGVMRREPASMFRRHLAPQDAAAWSMEGFATARQAYPAELKRGQEPLQSYAAWTNKVVDPAIAEAGYRLADTLEHAFGR
jgi:hypothetical protein